MPLIVSITTQNPTNPPAHVQRRRTGPEKTPKTKREQRNIDDDKAEATILVDQPGNERGWREHCPKPPNVLFNGVKCLDSYKRCKGASRRVIDGEV
jgi:hypothetical protein